MICASGATGLTSLNPLTGDINWYTSEFPQRTVASPTFANGMVIATCGSAGKGVQLLGVDPNATGAVQEADIRLRREKDLPYVPAIVGWQNYLFLWADNGVLQCLDLLTGKPAWQGRVGGNFSGSPVCIDGKLYCIEESGKVVVVNAGSKLLILGKNDLQDPSYSTPAVANNRLYLRSFHKVTSIRAEHSQ